MVCRLPIHKNCRYAGIASPGPFPHAFALPGCALSAIMHTAATQSLALKQFTWRTAIERAGAQCWPYPLTSHSTWNSWQAEKYATTKECNSMSCTLSPSLFRISRTSPLMNLGDNNGYPDWLSTRPTTQLPTLPRPTLLAYPVITRTSHHYLCVLHISFG